VWRYTEKARIWIAKSGNRGIFEMRFPGRVLIAVLGVAASIPLEAGPIFKYNLGPGVAVGDDVYNGFVAAGNRWSSVLTDDVTINVTISFQSLGAGILGSTSNKFTTTAYTTARAALVADAKSTADATAAAHLPVGSMSFAANHTSDCGNCTTPYLDNNHNNDNLNLDVSRAEGKALGLVGANDTGDDGDITFSSNFSFDFDPSNGIDPGKYDFVGVATHEIGHLLGFVSSVDDWDFCGASPSNCGGALSEAGEEPTVLDLFRYSVNPVGTGNIMDQSADGRAKYFSIDGGATLGPQFAQGVNFGDGAQASHWKDNLGIGIMDPGVSTGELLAITQNDITALDVIGWDATPEPFSWVLALAGIGAIALRRRLTSKSVC
jgi:hypothetical protein